jgi:hypothetical protein
LRAHATGKPSAGESKTSVGQKTAPAADKLLAGEGLSELFGLDLAAPVELRPRRCPRKGRRQAAAGARGSDLREMRNCGKVSAWVAGKR